MISIVPRNHNEELIELSSKRSQIKVRPTTEVRNLSKMEDRDLIWKGAYLDVPPPASSSSSSSEQREIGTVKQE